MRLLWIALASYFALLVVNLGLVASGPISISALRVVQLGLLPLALVGLWAGGREHPTIAASVSWPRRVPIRTVGRILAGTLAGLALATLLGLVLPLRDADVLAEYRQQGQSIAFALLDDCVIAPILEETVFRGIVLGALMVPFSRSGALWASSLMFASLHLTPFTFAHHTVLGLTLGYARLETRSLLVPMAIHGVYNAIVVFWSWPGP